MTMLTKIRNQSALLIGTIGVAMLLFILGGDFLRNSGRFFGTADNVVGIINGQEITYQDFERMVQNELLQLYGTDAVDEETRKNVRDRVWAKLLNELVMFKEFNKLGLSVSAEELLYQIKSDNPSPILAQYFIDPKTGQPLPQFTNPQTGRLDGEKILAAVQNMINNPEGEKSWVQIEQAIKLDRYNTKYNTLIKKGLYATNKEAEIDYFDKNNKYTFDYVLKFYADIKDEEIQYSESDLKKYYNEHKHEPFFQQEQETRKIEYVVFKVEPTVNDVKKIEEEISALKDAFANAENDSLFVYENSDNPNSIYWVKEGMLPADVDSLIFNNEKGFVAGPYEDGGYFKLAKKIDEQMKSDSVKARHILVKIQNGDTAKAQNLIDSLKTLIQKKNADFAELAQEFSEDFGSAQDGGDLGWFTEGQMVKPFNDACFNADPGDLVTVTTQFGIHLIEVLEKTAPHKQALVAFVERKIEPSKETYDKVYKDASAFSINNPTAGAFKTAGNELGIRVADNIKLGDKQIPGIPMSGEIVRWAFKAEKGTVSEPFEVEGAFIVALLSEIKPEGTLPLETDVVKQYVTQQVIKQKKAEKIKSELQGIASLEDAASKLGKKVETIEDITFASYTLPALGSELKVIGTACGIPLNKISEPVDDNKGVYVLKTTDFKEAQPAPNYYTNKFQLEKILQNRVEYEVFTVLEDLANVKDYRGRFY
ncbi:MAG: hypothetical protein D6707_10695 [Bacteroidetes bacterium]|nr:MAG: hypothetical protein D6707_10695 [Bacteroidota bacterium]